MKKLINLVIPSIIGSGLTIAVFLLFGLNHDEAVVAFQKQEKVAVHNAVYTVKENGEYVPLDFTGVSKDAMNSVVHISSARRVQRSSNPYSRNQNPFGDSFGEELFRFFQVEADRHQNHEL